MKHLQAFLRGAKSRAARRPVTFVIGNEAADLDSCVCAIIGAYLLKDAHENVVPLMSIPRADFALRTETLHHFEDASIDQLDLLFLDDVDLKSAVEDIQLVLVDHNVLCADLQHLQGGVVEIMDHHEDANIAYPKLTRKQIMFPLGSCASLLSQLVLDPAATSAGITMDSALARLLLGPVLIDTGNLDPAIGKTEALDSQMGATLTQQASFKEGELTQWFKALTDSKFDVRDLSTWDLLRKDYKQFCWGGTEVGIAAVLVPVQELLQRQDFLAELQRWLTERSLNTLLVMTGYFTHPGAGRGDDSSSSSSSSSGEQFNRQILVFGQDEQLRLKVTDLLKAEASLQLSSISHGTNYDAFQQQNIKPSRKQIAPLLKKSFL